MFIAGYLQFPKYGNNLCPVTDELIKKMWNTHTHSHEKWNSALCCNTDGPEWHYSKWNESEREQQMLYDITNMWNLKNTASEYNKKEADSHIESKLFTSGGGGAGSVQISCSDVSDSLQPHGLQHTRLPCPPPTPRACWNSCPSSRWWHPTISSSVIPFSSCLQSFPASGSFPVSQVFTWWRKYWSFSFSFSSSNEY